VGLPETQNQQGRIFDETRCVHICISKVSKKRKSNNEQGGDQQKLKSKTHNRQSKTRPISVCEFLIVIFKMLY